jgi:predicted enzyme related to lactoylglutathione lyase
MLFVIVPQHVRPTVVLPDERTFAMDVFKTHGAISWSELITPDPAAAAAFYGPLFGWAVQATDMPGLGTYHVLKVGEVSVGGIMPTPPDAPPGMPPMWGTYVTVDNVDSTLEKCTSLGGRVIVPAMDVPNVGRMAVIQDPQGALLNVMTYASA